MIKTDMAVIVEGKYDKIKLSSIIDGVIIETGGFRIFKDEQKCELIRKYALSKGIIILTDSDSAGFVIRNHIKGIVQGGKIVNVYIPEILGKEKRKALPSKEGILGVEGISKDIIINAFEKAGVSLSKEKISAGITKLDFFDAGLTGLQDSKAKRQKLLKQLGLPTIMSTNSMLEIINSMLTKEEFFQAIDSINKINELES